MADSLFPCSYTLLRSLFWTIGLAICVSAAPINDTLSNVTLPFPLTLTNHGNPRLVCVVPAGWTSLVVFYLGNFVAHAATLVTYPGEAPMSILRGILGALFFPTSGITRGLDAIFRRATFEKTNLQTAARAGALIHLIRTDSWRPSDGPEVSNNVGPSQTQEQARDSTSLLAIPSPQARGQTSHDEPNSRSSLGSQTDVSESAVRPPTSPTFYMCNGIWMKELPRFWPYFGTTLEMPRPHGAQMAKLNQQYRLDKILPKSMSQWIRDACSTERRIHGTIDLSTLYRNKTGYALEYVPRKAVIESLGNGSSTTLARSYSLVKAVVAIAQAIYAIATLVKAAQTQVDQLGYASFGLSVAPYAIMSLVNLIGNLCTPQYDALYLIETSVMREAIADGAVIDGQVGKLKVLDKFVNVEIETDKPLKMQRRETTGPNTLLTSMRRFTFKRMATEEPIEMREMRPSMDPDRQLSMTSEPGFPPLQAISSVPMTVPSARVDTEDVTVIGDGLFIAFTSPRFARTDDEALPITKIEAMDVKSRDLTMRQRLNNIKQRPLDQWFFDKRNRADIGIPWYSYLFYTVMSLLVGSSSLIVIGVVSKFKKNDSTPEQRGWIMSWIVSGIVIGTFVGFYNAVLEYRSRKGEGLRTMYKMLFLLFGLVFLAPPAVGGFVVVGKMLREYGNCATLYY